MRIGGIRMKKKKIKRKKSRKNEKELLGKKELKTFEEALAQEKEILNAKVKKHIEEGKEAYHEEVADLADQASDSYESEILYGLSDAERKYLEDVEGALKRIKEGNFGICVSCSSNIGMERLKALPTAKLCIKCKGKSEQKLAGGKNI